MQAHTVRHVEKFANFMSPVGLSISSQYHNSNPRKRQRFNHLTNPPNVHSTPTTTAATNNNSNSTSSSDSDHTPSKPATSSATSNKSVLVVDARRLTPTHSRSHNDELKQSQWHRTPPSTQSAQSLRLAHNRGLYFEAAVDRQAMDAVLDKLVLYGYETSADIAKMQPWQLRVLKREIPCIDYVFMTAYRLWGKPEFYDDHQNLAYRQFWDPAVWLQYNEIELVVQCFDASQRSYRCMVCGTRHGLHSLDELRWHILLDHKDDAQLTAVMQNSKKHHSMASLTHATRSISPNVRDKSRPTQTQRAQTKQKQKRIEISLLDDSSDTNNDDDDDDDEMAMDRAQPRKERARFSSKQGRAYTSRRRTERTEPTRKRRSRRLLNRQSDVNVSARPIELERAVADAAKRESRQTVQHPIIVNGAEEVHDDDVQCVEVHHSTSPAFMPSADLSQSVPMQRAMPCTTASTFSLETDATMTTMETDVGGVGGVGVGGIGDELNFPDDDGFSVMGFNDDFRELGMMSMLSRNSSNSFNDGLNLNSSFCKMDQSDSMEMI